MHELAAQLLSHLKAVWRYRWYAVIFAWVGAAGGWVFVHQMPNRYEASARVYVDTQSVLRPLLSGLAVQPNVDQIVTMMSRTLISRPNLEKVIRMADMDIKLKSPDDREAMIAQLTKGLTINSAGRENLYTISYKDKNPQESKRVVQSLLTIFVEGSLGDKRKDSDSARRFIDEQLKAYSDKLVAAETAVTEFKRKHVGLMPGEGKDYYSQLVQAKDILNQANLEFKEAENARDAIKKQLIGGEDEAPPSLLKEPGAQQGPLEAPNPEIDSRILGLQQKLDSLRLNYTEQHPDIVAILRTIAQLKEQKKAEARPATKSTPIARQTQNPLLQQMSLAIAEAEARMASMRARVTEYEKRYEQLKSAVNAIPQIEAEYKQLTRDYETTQGNYEKLLSRRESAQISGEMEANASVMDFRVIDPPQVPSAPNAPNRPLLMSVVLLVAIGGGIGFAFLISQLKPTIHDERGLREISGLPVFGAVIMAWTDAQRKKWKRGLIGFGLSLLSLLSAYAAIMALLMLTPARA